jgi:DNA-binding NtrC family response regulator
VKLLRVLGERTLERVGGNQPIEVDVRLVAATHRNLEALVKAGKFREDLFFRIRVVQIQVPPLRSRADDIPLLAEYFRKEYASENGKPHLQFSPESLKKLCAYSWPGNVRELRTSVEHGVVIARGTQIELSDLPASLRSGSNTVNTDESKSGVKLFNLEKNAIQDALKETGQNITAAAKRLGISRRTLHRKLVDSKSGKKRKT